MALVRGEGHPGGREPAPGDLRLIQDFVNTVDRENGVDLLGTRAGAQAWLSHRDLPGRANLAQMVEVREALRVLLLRAGGEADGHTVLERAARRGRIVPAFGPGTLRAEAGGLDGVLAEIAAAAFLAQADGRWARLKACPRSVCQWAFYDRSPNARATWCAMELCGNREKAAAHYRRAGPR